MEGMIGEIRLFAGNFAPRSWAFCQGQVLSIASNSALFSILGTTYGGNGQTTFALPNFQGRDVIGTGTGPGLNTFSLGQQGGTETNTLSVSNLPAHTHEMMASADSPIGNSASGAVLASNSRSTTPPMPNIYDAGSSNPVTMASTTGNSGGNIPMTNMQPYLVLNYIICLQGLFPVRN
jgi:microcystin-dependent protein